MRRILQICWLVGLLAVASSGSVWAEVIRLKSGKTIEGTILFENDEVVVIRDASGARYQYPKSELIDDSTIDDLQSSDKSKIQEDNETKEKLQQETVNTGRKVAMGISVFGGGMAMPGGVTSEPVSTTLLGGHAGAEVLVGTSNLFQRRIFLGGSIGYQAYMPGGQLWSFLPIKLRAEVPLTLKKHAPLLGMGMGYGIGLQNVKGGFCADVEFGWRCSYSRKGAIFMGVFADFEGAEITLTETVSDKDYTSQAYRNLCGFGAKMALYF